MNDFIVFKKIDLEFSTPSVNEARDAIAALEAECEQLQQLSSKSGTVAASEATIEAMNGLELD